MTGITTTHCYLTHGAFCVAICCSYPKGCIDAVKLSWAAQKWVGAASSSGEIHDKESSRPYRSVPISHDTAISMLILISTLQGVTSKTARYLLVRVSEQTASPYARRPDIRATTSGPCPSVQCRGSGSSGCCLRIACVCQYQAPESSTGGIDCLGNISYTTLELSDCIGSKSRGAVIHIISAVLLDYPPAAKLATGLGKLTAEPCYTRDQLRA